MFAQEKSEEEKHKTAAAHFHMSGYPFGLLHSSIPGGMPAQSFGAFQLLVRHKFCNSQL